MQSENKRRLIGSLATGKGCMLVLFTFVFCCSTAYAVGPYSVEHKTVMDQGTGLEWQKSGDTKLYTWKDALDYCENISLDSRTDWRLPNIRELKSLVDYSRYYPAVDPVVPCQSSIYWSSTTVANDTHLSAWSIFFANGDDLWKEKIESLQVRCVRGGLSE